MNNLETALTKELCIICTKETEGAIVMNKILTKKEANKIKDLHGKVVGFADKPCNACKEMLNKSFIFIGYDENQSDMNNLPQGFYRTGHIVGVKKDIPLVEEHIKNNYKDAYTLGYIFIPFQIMKEMNLIN